MYIADDFNTENAPKEMVQFVIDSVVDFDTHYGRALEIIGIERCPLKMADRRLYDTISEVIDDWCSDHEDNIDYDIEEIFG
mgnify:CR=1 FL=1